MRHFFEPLESRRLLDAGQLDTTFGMGGHTVLSGSHSLGEIGLDLPPEDQIVVTAADEGRVEGMAQLTGDGKVEPNFGPLGDGTFTVPAITVLHENGEPAGIPTVTVVGDDGAFFILQGNVIFKFKRTGVRDKTFGKNGRAIVHALAPLDVHDLTVDDQGRTYVIGQDANSVVTIVRLASNGKPDLDFGMQSILQPHTSNYPDKFRGQKLADG